MAAAATLAAGIVDCSGAIEDAREEGRNKGIIEGMAKVLEQQPTEHAAATLRQHYKSEECAKVMALFENNSKAAEIIWRIYDDSSIQKPVEILEAMPPSSATGILTALASKGQTYCYGKLGEKRVDFTDFAGVLRKELDSRFSQMMFAQMMFRMPQEHDEMVRTLTLRRSLADATPEALVALAAKMTQCIEDFQREERDDVEG